MESSEKKAVSNNLPPHPQPDLPAEFAGTQQLAAA